MKAPDKIYLPVVEEEGKRLLCTIWWSKDDRTPDDKFVVDNIPYIRKDALMEWVQKEMERLWELLPDASNDNPTQMELRYLGQYMQMEALEDKLNSM